MDKQKVKNDILELFESHLASVLEMENTGLLEELNDDIIRLIDDDNFKREMEQAIYSNGQKLTHKHFELDGKPRTPSVRNWVRNFISLYGSEIFDNVVLARFVNYSPNTKNLDDREKKLVQKLLVLYRNLKFFPFSMGDLPADRWEIVPIGTSRSEELDKARNVSGPPKTEDERRIEELEAEEEDYAPNSLEHKALEEEVGRKKSIARLEGELARHKNGSFEYMAIKQEINKMKE